MHWIWSYIIIFVGLVLPKFNALITDIPGCHHNGTTYAEKSLVPTTAKCLSCLCNKGSLVCRLKVCPEMPMPPAKDCVVVQQKNTCCPYVSCARSGLIYRGTTSRRIIAYLDHYERETIDRVVNENALQRRSDDSDMDPFVCVKNGTVYKSGSAMSSSSLCSYCYCIGGTEKCVQPKCMLPVEGCKPIFVDSTCCPVRYDCNIKPLGKSSQESRYRKVGNKHFLRLSQHLQRIHGCNLDSQFYGEGQKMPSDNDRPCDICFCIRGSRKCAPKKCSPSLKNCIPVVPNGQCCPSSYDCESQKDHSRKHNSRQFNLFSLIFGPGEEEGNVTESAFDPPPDRHPEMYGGNKVIPTTSEKSLFDTIRESLELIDRNEQILIDDLTIPSTESSVKNINNSNIISATGANFLDLILEPLVAPPESIANAASKPELKTTSSNYENLSWVDLLLGEEVLTTEKSIELKPMANTKIATIATKNPLDDMLSTTTLVTEDLFSGNEVTTDIEEREQYQESTYMYTEKNNLPDKLVTEQIISRTESEDFEGFTSTPAEETTLSTLHNFIFETTTQTLENGSINDEFNKIQVIEANIATLTDKTNATELDSGNGENVKNDFLSALFDGLSTIFKTNAEQNISGNSTWSLYEPNKSPGLSTTSEASLYDSITTTTTTTTNIPIPSESEKTETDIQKTPGPTMPTIKSPTNLHVVASEIASLPFKKIPIAKIVTPSTIPFKTLPPVKITTAKPIFKETLSKAPITPVFIKTFPTILYSGTHFDNAEPTLPPSLPNLKIIPFLPTDAVKSNRKQSLYEFNKHNILKNSNIKTNKDKNTVLPTNSPAIVVDGHWPNIPFYDKNSKIDLHLYDEANMYPAITEMYPAIYPDIEESNKAEYIYKFNVEGPLSSSISSSSSSVSIPGGSISDPSSVAAFAKFNYISKSNGFSPPTKTEGGFVPKEILTASDVYRHFIIDITTAVPPNTTKIIEITTADPFKDVIRTEPSPNLLSLIEDKEKRPTSSENPFGVTYLSDKNTIHITTDAPSNSSEYVEYPISSKDSSNFFSVDFNQSTILPHMQNKSNGKNVSVYKDSDAISNILEKFPDRNQSLQLPPFKSIPQEQQNATSNDDLISVEMNTVLESTTVSPFPMAPFNKLPFMDASIEVKPNSNLKTNTMENNSEKDQSRNIPKKFEGLSPAFESFLPAILKIPERKEEKSPPLAAATLESSSLESPHLQFSSNFIDSTGLLKLAGCNIYGRMYRVGKIILELSSPCLECKCTEVGVKCTDLQC